MNWRLLPLSSPTPAIWNMAVDEALLDGGHPAPTLRFYRWDRPAYSIGYFQSVERVARENSCTERRTAVIRRITGGGLVPHGEDLTLSIVMPESNPFFPKKSVESYRAVHGLLLESLKGDYPGLEAADSRRSLAPRDQASCFAQATCVDLVIRGKKAVGSSQRRRNGRVLHQTALFLEGDPAEIAGMVRRGFERNLGVRFEPGALSAAEERKACELAREKYSRPDFSLPIPCPEPGRRIDTETQSAYIFDRSEN